MVEYSAYVGLDIHKETITVAGRKGPVYRGAIANKLSSLHRLVGNLRARRRCADLRTRYHVELDHRRHRRTHQDFSMLVGLHGRGCLAPLYDVAGMLPCDVDPGRLKMATKIGGEYLL